MKRIGLQKRNCLYKCYSDESNVSTYGYVGSSLFDLIGTREPDQTKSLGYVLARSEVAMNLFLNQIVEKQIVKKYMSSDCIVVCERFVDSCNDTVDRADIVIRFPKYNEVIIVEAKSLNAKTKTKDAIKQAICYAEKMHYDKCTIVSLTNNKEYCITKEKGFSIVSMQWSDIIDIFDTIVRKYKDNDISLEKDFLNYLLKINGLMNYYDIEVLSIPAGDTVLAVEETSIYECPSEKAPYRSRGEHKPLFMAFRGEKGLVKKLYKVESLIATPISGPDYEMFKETHSKELVDRIEKYKEIVKYEETNGDTQSKWVFFLDDEKSIVLDPPVKYKRNNSFVETKRPLKDYFDKKLEKDGFIYF